MSILSGKELVSSDGIQSRIYSIRGLQVMLDSDLADLYQVEVKMLNRAVKRNLDRFPQEFMFQLTEDEFQSLKVSIEDLKNGNPLRFQFGTLKNKQVLRSQSVTLNDRRGQHRKYLPCLLRHIMSQKDMRRRKRGAARHRTRNSEGTPQK